MRVASAAGFVHTSGLPLRVSDRLIAPNVAVATSNAWSASTTSHRPDAATSLAIALLHAARNRSRENGRWIADAQVIVRSGAVEWPRFVELVRQARGSGVVATQLRWLMSRHFCDVPMETIAELEAVPPDAIERQLELRGLYAGHRPWWGQLYRSSNVSMRAELLKATLFPRRAATGGDGVVRRWLGRAAALRRALAARFD